MFLVLIRALDTEVPLMSTHDMFSWRNKKTISTLRLKKSAFSKVVFRIYHHQSAFLAHLSSAQDELL